MSSKEYKYDVAFYEVFEEEKIFLKKYLPEDCSYFFTSKTIEEAKHPRPIATIVCVRTQSRIPQKWFPEIQGVFTRSQGFDHLKALKIAQGNKISCGHLNDYCSCAVAEQSILSMLFLMRRMHKQITQMRTFNRDDLTGTEARHKKVFVLGVGNIGKEIVKICRGLEMDVRGFDIVKRVPALRYCSLRQGLSWADVIFCALPLNQKTINIVNFLNMKHLKNNPVLINVSRAEITPIQDMKKLLDRKILSGLAMDVFPEEDQLGNYLRSGRAVRICSEGRTVLSLMARDNVLMTPHNAFNTHESVDRKAKETAEAIQEFFNTGRFLCSV